MSVFLFVEVHAISFVIFNRLRHVRIVRMLNPVATPIFSKDVIICPRFISMPRQCISSCVADISRYIKSCTISGLSNHSH